MTLHTTLLYAVPFGDGPKTLPFLVPYGWPILGIGVIVELLVALVLVAPIIAARKNLDYPALIEICRSAPVVPAGLVGAFLIFVGLMILVWQ
jgi:hypothetical protein